MNMTGSEVTKTFGLFDKTVMCVGRVAKSKKSDFYKQIIISVGVTFWLLAVNLLLGRSKTRHGNIGQPQ